MNSAEKNICKIVTNPTGASLTAANFVYEQRGVRSGESQHSANNGIYLVVSGSGRLENRAGTFPLEAGTLFFTLAGEEFVLHNAGMVYMYISFRGSRAAELFERFGVSSVSPVFTGYAGLISFWKNAISRATAQNLDLISEAVLLYTFSQMVPPAYSSDQALTNRILRHIEASFTDSTLSLASCAAELGYSAKYLSRVFKTYVGVTFSEYLKNIRIRHAIFLIEQGLCVVKNVAFLSGYENPLYFSKVFHDIVGVSPREYISRQTLAGNAEEQP